MSPHAHPRGPQRPPSTHERIWSVVRRIPRGRVATYGQVASMAGFPSQPRLAGYALHALRAHSPVPWHRVVNARGRISLPAIDGQYELQRAMLEAEGIVFYEERIDLARQGWKAPAQRELSPARRATRPARPSPPGRRAAPGRPPRALARRRRVPRPETR